jgi:hypothetical protein
MPATFDYIKSSGALWVRRERWFTRIDPHWCGVVDDFGNIVQISDKQAEIYYS